MCVCMYIYVYICVCVCVCMSINASSPMCENPSYENNISLSHTYPAGDIVLGTHTNTHTHTHTHTLLVMATSSHTNTHTQSHTHTHTHTLLVMATSSWASALAVPRSTHTATHTRARKRVRDSMLVILRLRESDTHRDRVTHTHTHTHPCVTQTPSTVHAQWTDDFLFAPTSESQAVELGPVYASLYDSIMIRDICNKYYAHKEQVLSNLC
jgi:hypothetical protein